MPCIYVIYYWLQKEAGQLGLPASFPEFPPFMTPNVVMLEVKCLCRLIMKPFALHISTVGNVTQTICVTDLRYVTHSSPHYFWEMLRANRTLM